MNNSVIDLFSGIGGLSLGIVRAGFRLALSVDNDRIPMRVHELNFPGCAHRLGDIASMTGGDLLQDAGVVKGELAGLVGGPPCQGFSHIGKRNKADVRNSLFGHFFRLVSETKPAFYLAENVLGILDPHNAELVQEALRYVDASYTMLDPIILNAADFGAPTNRRRVLFIGFDPRRMNAVTHIDVEQARWTKRTTVGIALHGLPHRLGNGWTTDENAWRPVRVKKKGRFWQKIRADRPDGVGDEETLRKYTNDRLVSGCITTVHTEAVKLRFSKIPAGKVDEVSRAIRLNRAGLCPTLRAGTGPDRGSFQALRPIHYSQPRMITPREAARLQGFPDWFRFDFTKWHAFRGIGNSVSPLLGEAVLSVLRSKLR
jgi:DNA (cytosine-5)-methyltransferase 1